MPNNYSQLQRMSHFASLGRIQPLLFPLSLSPSLYFRDYSRASTVKAPNERNAKGKEGGEERHNENKSRLLGSRRGRLSHDTEKSDSPNFHFPNSDFFFNVSKISKAKYRDLFFSQDFELR